MNRNNKFMIFQWQKLFCSRCKISRNGFSLIETLVAILIFSIAVVMFVGAFASFLKTYLEEKKNQKNFESAQHTINLMAKSIRTSEIEDFSNSLGTDHFDTFDYTQNKCIQYRLSGRILQIATPAGTNFGNCQWETSPYSNLTSDIIQSARIEAERSDDSGAQYSFGKATILLMVKDNSQLTVKIPVQTTVSLRQ